MRNWILFLLVISLCVAPAAASIKTCTYLGCMNQTINLTANMTAGPAGANSSVDVNATFYGAFGTIPAVTNVGTNQTTRLDFLLPLGEMNQTPNMTVLVGSTWYDHNQFSPDVAGYKVFNRSYPFDGENSSSVAAMVAGTEYLIDSFVTNSGDPGLHALPAGERIWYTNAKVSSTVGGNSYIVIRLYKRDTSGLETEMYNLTTSALPTITTEIVTTKMTPYDIPMNTTDRFVAKYYAKTDSAANPTITLYYDGTTHISRATSPINQGIQGPPGPTGPQGATGPAGSSGGVVLYFNHTSYASPAGYEGLDTIPSGATEVDESVTVRNVLGEVLIDPYISAPSYPGAATLPAGLWQFRTYHYVDGASGTTTVVFKVYNRTATGTETLLFTATSGDIDSLTDTQYATNYVQTNPYTIAATDRIVIKVYGQTTHASNILLHFVYQGATHTSNVQTPLSVQDASTLTFTVLTDGTAISKGQAVYISGASGSTPIVSLADNTNTAKSRVAGLMVADTLANSIGQVRRSGTLPNVDTRSTSTAVNPLGQTWVAGDLLFATSSGGLTNVRPTSGRTVKAAYSMVGSNINDVLLAYPLENPVWATAASGEGVVLRLGDSIGGTNVSIRNYANTQVAAIDSDGTIFSKSIIGSTTSGESLTLNGSSSNNGDVRLNPNGGNVGINNLDPSVPLQVGASGTIYSLDPGIAISRTIDSSGSGNAHAFSDSSIINRAGTIGYNSYDAPPVIFGTSPFDHYVAFQANPTYQSSGQIGKIYAIYSLPTISGGGAVSNYGAYFGNPSGSGTVTNNYGVYFDGTTRATNNYALYVSRYFANGGTNYSIYSDTPAKSFLRGNLGIGPLGTTADKNLQIFTNSGEEAAIRLYQNSWNYWDISSPASSTRFAIADVTGEKFSIANPSGYVTMNGYGQGICSFDSSGVISSQSYLAGTKTYYVSDTSGGNATRKLTFTNGILTSET